MFRFKVATLFVGFTLCCWQLFLLDFSQKFCYLLVCFVFDAVLWCGCSMVKVKCHTISTRATRKVQTSPEFVGASGSLNLAPEAKRGTIQAGICVFLHWLSPLFVSSGWTLSLLRIFSSLKSNVCCLSESLCVYVYRLLGSHSYSLSEGLGVECLKRQGKTRWWMWPSQKFW